MPFYGFDLGRVIRPVLVCQFSEHVRPGVFGEYLTAHGIAWTLLRVDQGEPIPRSIAPYSGLGLMGGQMSVNDPLPWIEHMGRLILEADQHHRPVIGHCLGGQLMSKAFGASVRAHVRKELGWTELSVVDPGVASEWLGPGVHSIPSFQWHGDTFDLPDGALHLLRNAACDNQAFVLHNKAGVAHLGMQCHMEMTPDLVREWAMLGRDEIEQAARQDDLAVQSVQQMTARVEQRCEQMGVYTRRMYDRWVQGLYCG